MNVDIASRAATGASAFESSTPMGGCDACDETAIVSELLQRSACLSSAQARPIIQATVCPELRGEAMKARRGEKQAGFNLPLPMGSKQGSHCLRWGVEGQK